MTSNTKFQILLRWVAVALLLLGKLWYLQSANYYWHGKTGAWHEMGNWSQAPEEDIRVSSLPSLQDTVHFNAKWSSIRRIHFAAGTHYVHTILFDEKEFWTFESDPESILHIEGSFQLPLEINWNFQGDLIFLGNSAGSIIRTEDHVLEKVTIAGRSQSFFSLESELFVRSELNFYSGIFHAHHWPIQCGRLQILPKSELVLEGLDNHIQVTGPHLTNYPSVFIQLGLLEWHWDQCIFELTHPMASWVATGKEDLHVHTLTFSATDGLVTLQQDLPYEQYAKMNIENLFFYGSAYILHSNDFGFVHFEAGKSYFFESSQLQVIDGLEASGQCGEPIYWVSSINGVPAGLSLSFNDTWRHIHVKDIENLGSGDVQLLDCSAAGSTLGFKIASRPAQTLYWVGGTGHWNNPHHWSLESGGIGGHCIPSFADIVIFDELSFPNGLDTIYAEGQDLFCHDLRWRAKTKSAVFKGSPNQRLHIFGQTEGLENMRWDFPGDVWVEKRSLRPHWLGYRSR